MSSAAEAGPKRAEINLDLDQLVSIMHVGIRRSSAFLKLGIQIADLEMPGDMVLTGGMSFNFWPNNLSDEVKEGIRKEFRAWLIGSCLRELDQHLSLFLDQAWHLLRLSELHGKTLPSSEMIEFDKRFAAETNTSRKFAALKEKIDIEIAADSHNSLSLARNSLTHGMGRVRSRDCNRDSALEVLWISPEGFLQDGDKEILLRDAVFERYLISSPEGATVTLRFTKHRKIFKLGEQIEFSAHELAEICFFYHQQAEVTKAGMLNYFKAKGINPRVPVEAT